ncbi:MAG: hypothetical protein ACJ8FM_03000 [Xanthobacteraceae bacterium]
MQASSPLPENIVRKLESAIDRLNDDFERVEFWAAALNAFLQPVPGYEAPHGEFLLGHKESSETGATEPRQRRSAHS